MEIKTCQFCIIQKFKIWNPQRMGTALICCISKVRQSIQYLSEPISLCDRRCTFFFTACVDKSPSEHRAKTFISENEQALILHGICG